MPYQGTSQSVGFRQRQVIDPSKRMRQEAAQIQEQGQQRIQGMREQASQEIQEMKRVADLEASNARYELNALSKFSNTINKLLQEDVVGKIQENRQAEVNRGIEMYATNPQAVAAEKQAVADTVEQQRSLHDKIEAEAQKAPNTEAANRVRSLSKFEQMGWDFAAMREAANGWAAHRESELETNTTRLLDHDGTPFILKDYDRSSLDQYDIAVRYLQTQYISKHNPKNFKAHIRNTTLTQPILESSATARRQQVLRVNRDRASAAIDAEENILAAAFRGDPGSTDPAKQILTFLESTHAHYDTLGAQNGGRRAARARIASIADTVIDEAKDPKDAAARIIIALESAKIKGHPSGEKTLFELYGDEFSVEALRGKAIQAEIDRSTRELRARRQPAEEELINMLETFHSLSPGDRVARSTEFIQKFPAYPDLHNKILNWDSAILSPERSREKLADLLLQSEGSPVPLSSLKNINSEVLKEALDNGQVEEVSFGADSPSTVKASAELVTGAIKGAAKLSVADPLDDAGQKLANTKALNQMMRDARDIKAQAELENRPMTDAQAIDLSARNLVKLISGVNDSESKFYDETSPYYAGTSGGFQNLLTKLPETYLIKQRAVTQATRYYNDGKNLREHNVTAGLPDREFELTPKGTPTSLMTVLAKLEGVTPLEMMQAQRKLNGKPELPVDPATMQMVQMLDKVPHLKRSLAQDLSPSNVSRVLRELGIPETRSIMKAIGYQESRGDYMAYNADAYGAENPALGKYQILWKNVNPWARDAGMPGKPNELAFRRDGKYQERLASAKFNQYMKIAAGKSNDLQTIVRMVAAAWYGGGGRMDDYDNPNVSGGPGYPNMREYTMSVWSRY